MYFVLKIHNPEYFAQPCLLPVDMVQSLSRQVLIHSQMVQPEITSVNKYNLLLKKLRNVLMCLDLAIISFSRRLNKETYGWCRANISLAIKVEIMKSLLTSISITICNDLPRLYYYPLVDTLQDDLQITQPPGPPDGLSDLYIFTGALLTYLVVVPVQVWVLAVARGEPFSSQPQHTCMQSISI